jgi:hypothetical protein
MEIKDNDGFFDFLQLLLQPAKPSVRCLTVEHGYF